MNAPMMRGLAAYVLKEYAEGNLPPLLREGLTVFLNNPALQGINQRAPDKILAALLYAARKATVTGELLAIPAESGEATDLNLEGVVEAIQTYLRGNWTSRLVDGTYFEEPLPLKAIVAGLGMYHEVLKAEVLKDPFTTVLSKFQVGCFDYVSADGKKAVDEGKLKDCLFAECRMDNLRAEAEDLWYRCQRHAGRQEYREIITLFYDFEGLIPKSHER